MAQKYPTLPAKEVPLGGIFLHPKTNQPLRRLRPAPTAFVSDKTFVLAVDDEGFLYTIFPTTPVEVPPHSRMVLENSQDSYLITAVFQRELSEDMEVMEANYASGQITADPKEDLHLAVQQQLALEMSEVYDNGMAGNFQCQHVTFNMGFNYEAMGWVPKLAITGDAESHD